MTFKEDLKAGESSEEEFARTFPIGGIYKMIGMFKFYDLYSDHNGKKYEVKRDFKSQRTGNIVVEFEFDGKPSGISTSTADFWAFHVSKEEWIIVETNRLRNLLMFGSFKKYEFIGNGDTKKKKAFLVKKKYIKGIELENDNFFDNSSYKI